ncbi:hypothetical protein PR048_003824 [Dryococelus australis]|uniref:Uncharacterized protein n=1 Tax=Dryococelus australis TaxID=614101 RepID=A0ABQ9IQ75_9NEOP|nr:hypothetical protein PR048_003824 [Dryococelus australis]
MAGKIDSKIQKHEISLVQHFYTGTKIKLDPVSELGSFDLGSGTVLVQPGIGHSAERNLAGWRSGLLRGRGRGRVLGAAAAPAAPALPHCWQQSGAACGSSGVAGAEQSLLSESGMDEGLLEQQATPLQRRDGNTVRRARRSDEALGVRVSVALIAPSRLHLGRGVPTGVHPTRKYDRCNSSRGRESGDPPHGVPLSRLLGNIHVGLAHQPHGDGCGKPQSHQLHTLASDISSLPTHSPIRVPACSVQTCAIGQVTIHTCILRNSAYGVPCHHNFWCRLHTQSRGQWRPHPEPTLRMLSHWTVFPHSLAPLHTCPTEPLLKHSPCTRVNMKVGAAVAQWLGRSPPTTAIRARSPAGSLQDPRIWESCWTMPLAGGLSRDTPAYPALALQLDSPSLVCLIWELRWELLSCWEQVLVVWLDARALLAFAWCCCPSTRTRCSFSPIECTVSPVRRVAAVSAVIGCCLLEKAFSYLTGPLRTRQHRHGSYVIRVHTVNTCRKVIQPIKTGCASAAVLTLHGEAAVQLHEHTPLHGVSGEEDLVWFLQDHVETTQLLRYSPLARRRLTTHTQHALTTWPHTDLWFPLGSVAFHIALRWRHCNSCRADDLTRDGCCYSGLGSARRRGGVRGHTAVPDLARVAMGSLPLNTPTLGHLVETLLPTSRLPGMAGHYSQQLPLTPCDITWQFSHGERLFAAQHWLHPSGTVVTGQQISHYSLRSYRPTLRHLTSSTPPRTACFPATHTITCTDNSPSRNLIVATTYAPTPDKEELVRNLQWLSCSREPSEHFVGVISGNYGKPESGWPDRESNLGPPERESSCLTLRHLGWFRRSWPGGGEGPS